jgi:hypothetical protein
MTAMNQALSNAGLSNDDVQAVNVILEAFRSVATGCRKRYSNKRRVF